MKKLAIALAFLAVFGLVGQSFADTSADKCPKKGWHVDKDGKCVKIHHKKHAA